MEKKTALVMTGGGARAAYQVGVVRAIYEILRADQGLFDLITGNSAGAINASYLASQASDWDMATKHLTELWLKIKPQNVFDLSARSISDLGTRWVSGAIFGGLTSGGSQVNHLLDTSPLLKLIQKEIDFQHLNTNLRSGKLHGLSLSTTNYGTGASVLFYQGHPSIADWTRTDRFSMREDFQPIHVMASAAIPFFFPPAKIRGGYFGDGCIRQTTPLSPSIHMGAEKIICVGVRHPRNAGELKEQVFANATGSPSIGQISGILLDAVFLDSLEPDIERLERINQLVKAGNHPRLKEIPILMIRPSRDLGKMTEKLHEELPRMLRYLLKGIGVTDHEGLDLLSYLAFDRCYTLPLMELGYDDAFRMKDEILRFSDA